MRTTTKQALLLVGSPRGFKSSSNSMGTYLLDKFHEAGFETGKLHVQAAMRSEATKKALLQKTRESDIIIFAFPLYIDSLHARLIPALEMIAEENQKSAPPKQTRLAVIVNSGFPEAFQNTTVVDICRCFASEAGMQWAGGLMYGGGEAIHGVPLEKAGMAAKNARSSLDIAAKDLLEGRAISKEAVDLMGKLVIPRWLFLLIANRRWKKEAEKLGTKDKIDIKL
ncbi:MAG: hypothetical protein NWF01_11280 [Candidatus Bathyarchaeota archaeon]|nr:hypothetical protein [Candidatus Bathyarchaeota archaeon]